MELIPHGLSPRLFLAVFAVWLSSEIAPLPHPAPYPRKGPPEAVPQYVSESTSYHQVRLAFHSYPHLIRRLFTVHRFGPPVGLTPPSPWTWVAHLASGRSHRTLSPFPSRGAFHLSLTVLLLYRSVGVFSLGEWSPLIHTGFHVPGTTWDRSSAPAPFGYRTVTFFGIPSQRFLLNAFRLSGWAQPPLERPPTPKTQRPRA